MLRPDHMIFTTVAEPTGGWTNESQDFFLVLGVALRPQPAPGPGEAVLSSGVLTDPSGTVMDQYYQTYYNSKVVAGTLSDEVFEVVCPYEKKGVLVAPGWGLSGFGQAYGFMLSRQELEQMILGGGGVI